MKHSKYRSTAGQACLLGGLLTAAFGLGSIPAIAQDDVEEIFITGSRIARDPNLGGAIPVSSIDAEQIRVSGEFGVAEVVNDVPALLTSITSDQSQEQSDGVLGATNRLNLRGLGSNRTLTLVDSRRHVGGAAGTAAVDVGSIPMALVESVEVITGGASAIYGADAVTGVVNFILKDDFEGFQLDMNYGVSDEGDAAQSSVTATYGFNFDDDRGNLAVSVDYRSDEGLLAGERPNGVFLGSTRDWANPYFRFQPGEITAADTPNFAAFYDPARGVDGLPTYGLRIPTAADFVASYNGAGLGNTIVEADLTAAELALINRTTDLPGRALLPGRTFPFTSGYGYIHITDPFNFGFEASDSPDLNNNGTPDCLESYTGYAAAEDYGAIGGCWNILEDGTIRPIQDGLVSSATQGFGGDAFNTIANATTPLLTPADDLNINLIGHYDLTDNMRAFAEVKYVSQESDYRTDPNSYWDLLPGYADNPFIPTEFQAIAQRDGLISITVDPIGFGASTEIERETTRYVFGLEGEFDNGIGYEVAYNYGKFERNVSYPGTLIADRFFAAIDAVIDPGTNSPACRISVDPAAPPVTTPFDIPAWDPGYYSFDAADCVPLDIWSGQAGYDNQAARDFITYTAQDNLVVDQSVFSAIFTGDLGIDLGAGEIAWAAGFEYREETSDARSDSIQRGIIPDGLPNGGQPISSVSGNESLVFQPSIRIVNESGKYDVTDMFAEVSIPLLSGVPLAENLTLEAAFRQADYSTIGDASTWKANVIWAPVEDFVFRGSVSQAVRAPNIGELFAPRSGTTFRPNDPCDFNNFGAYADPATIEANCTAQLTGLGIDVDADNNNVYDWVDPLTAAFPGIVGGNPNLVEETADTTTFGFVWEPGFLDGFSLTMDYWDITLEDAIGAVSSQDIVDGCYLSAAGLNPTFCGQFERNNTTGGFIYLESTDVNFASSEVAGIDFQASYSWMAGDNAYEVTLSGSQMDKYVDYTNPLDPTDGNDGLGENQLPEWSGNLFVQADIGDSLSLGWQAQYVGEQLVRYTQIETAAANYGDAAFADATFIHDINATWRMDDGLTVYGGVKNVTGEEPYGTSLGFPVSVRGRMLHVGFTYSL